MVCLMPCVRGCPNVAGDELLKEIGEALGERVSDM